jgi:catechol 2,3-dioxygenase-like lactoylglutathione lyase family enzyme
MTRPTTQAISPFLIVSDVDRTIAFYRDKLGFETRFQQPDRNPFFAIVGRDGAQILIKSIKTRRRCRTPSVIHP